MSETPDPSEKSISGDNLIAYGIAFGMMAGATLGVFFDSIGVSTGFGMLVGIVIAMLIQDHRKRAAKVDGPINTGTPE